MKKWLKKSTVLLVTILTLGLYVPPISIDADVDKSTWEPKEDQAKPVETQTQEDAISQEDLVFEEDSDQLYLQALNQAAKEKLTMKLGSKIGSKVNEEVEQVILPNLDEVLDTIYEEKGKAASQYLMIAEDPSGGYGERIFNLYDANAKENIAKFHVNRLRKPQDGYYFQFHYHLKKDQFEEHLPIGEVYWGKDTPPKWMST
ncbi:YpjP family protein [Gracilibacillus timonensis]|uniref:YpjP family protein n=1 Tax=Gracilibacillus timonensis TaxID=1816696 RepID=UPI000824CA6D|nr:YpjP family protein [Gracilibacillus timonensis]